jgi:3-oxoadipate enol-lactonase
MPTMELEGHSIYYREFGERTSPPLFLVHGLYSDSSTMEPLAGALAAHFHVIAPDMLGHGQSSHPADFSLSDQGRVLNRLVEALGHDEAALLGVSMGSYVAAQAAILEPSRTSRLLLVVPKAHGKTSSVAAYAERIGADLSAVSPEEMLEILAGALWSPATPQERRDEIMASAATQVVLTPDEKAAVERSLAGFDLRPELGAITAPTLVISGRADGLNPPSAGEEVARLVPRAELRVYERSGHMLTAEETDRLVADTTAFVLGGGGGAELSAAAVS